MFDVADLRERVILSMATDLGLRIGDFIALKKAELPSLNQEMPIPFELMTDKEDVVAHGFLSHETVDLLKAYLPTLEKKNGNPHLFPSNGESHISDEWLNRLLQNLAAKAGIDLNGKDLTFHCFRKMFLSAAIDSGIGLTAGKKLCGKAIAQSDDTYLTTVHLREKFMQLKRFLAIQEQPKMEIEKIEALKNAVNRLQEDLTQQRLITETISEENVRTKKEIDRLQPLMAFVESLRNQNDELRLYLTAMAGTERMIEAEKEGKSISSISQTPEEELTDEEGIEAAGIYDRINVELAKTLRKALDIGLDQLTKKQERQSSQG